MTPPERRGENEEKHCWWFGRVSDHAGSEQDLKGGTVQINPQSVGRYGDVEHGVAAD